jgi:hypothetical protein
MKLIALATLLLLSITGAFAQDREAKIKLISEYADKIRLVGEELLQPSASDKKLAQERGLSALRLLPRGKFEERTFDRGGGAYYSFTTDSHSYDRTPQIQLEQDYLSVGGFYGANYGFIADLGERTPESVSRDEPSIAFLLSYDPSGTMEKVRSEQAKRGNYMVGDLTFTSRVPVAVGRSYAARSISFDEADILVTFQVLRKDTDGSVILLWKRIESFDKPVIQKPTISKAFNSLQD